MKGSSTSSAGRDRFQRLNFQLTSKIQLTKQNFLFPPRGPSPGETRGCQKETETERKGIVAQRASTGAEQGGKGRGHLTSAAGGRRPSVTRGSLVSGGSCLPTTELPSMSKGKALSSPDAEREQAAPQRSHRGRTERHQPVLQAISPLLMFNRPFLERRIWGSWWAPPEVQRCLVFYLLWAGGI